MGLKRDILRQLVICLGGVEDGLQGLVVGDLDLVEELIKRSVTAIYRSAEAADEVHWMVISCLRTERDLPESRYSAPSSLARRKNL